jgi:hypothetical protein
MTNCHNASGVTWLRQCRHLHAIVHPHGVARICLMVKIHGVQDAPSPQSCVGDPDGIITLYALSAVYFQLLAPATGHAVGADAADPAAHFRRPSVYDGMWI